MGPNQCNLGSVHLNQPLGFQNKSSILNKVMRFGQAFFKNRFKAISATQTRRSL